MCSRPVKHPSLHCLPGMPELYPSPKSPSSLEQKGSRLVRLSLGSTAPSLGSQVQSEKPVLNPLVYRGHCEHMPETPSNHDPLVKNTLGLRSAYSYGKFSEDVPDSNQERPPARSVSDAFLVPANFSALFSGITLWLDSLKGERQHSSRGSSLTSLRKDEEEGERKMGYF